MSRSAEWKAARRSRKGIAPVFNYVAAGKNQQALDCLERASEEHDPNMPYIGVMGKYYGLRKEPRYQDLLRLMSFPEDVLTG